MLPAKQSSHVSNVVPSIPGRRDFFARICIPFSLIWPSWLCHSSVEIFFSIAFTPSCICLHARCKENSLSSLLQQSVIPSLATVFLRQNGYVAFIIKLASRDQIEMDVRDMPHIFEYQSAPKTSLQVHISFSDNLWDAFISHSNIIEFARCVGCEEARSWSDMERSTSLRANWYCHKQDQQNYHHIQLLHLLQS